MTTFYATRPTTRTATFRPAPVRPATRPIPADLYRDGDRYVVSADLPGIDPASVDIAVDGRTLSIRAERTAPAGAELRWVSRERQAGSYSRRFTLGDSIDTDRIAARYDNGVLDVTLPVIEKTKPRSIRIQGVQAAPVSEAPVSDTAGSDAAVEAEPVQAEPVQAEPVQADAGQPTEAAAA